MNRRRSAGALATVATLVLAYGCTTDPAQPGTTRRMTENRCIGSRTCGACHQHTCAAWKQTCHSKMVRPVREGLLKDAVAIRAKDSKGNAGPTKANITGTPAKLGDVVYVIGSKWKQRYLVKSPGTGNHRFLDKQWNRATRLWENQGQKSDRETRCSTCHATGFRITSSDPANTKAMKVSLSEHNTGCEWCHGPGQAHASSRSKADIVNPRGASKADADKVCGYCPIRTENSNWRTAQGNVSEHLRSKHAKADLLSCIDCHFSHGPASKQVAARAACAGCHGASMDAKKTMPGLARTAGGLMMRAHMLNRNPRAPRGTTADQLPPPVCAYPAGKWPDRIRCTRGRPAASRPPLRFACRHVLRIALRRVVVGTGSARLAVAQCAPGCSRATARNALKRP